MDRSSTRTHHSSAQHHSRSQWSLGWGEEAQAPRNTSVSSNAFASGSNMNAGNVISDRPTTRLHAPPGGYTSDIFGTGAASASRPAPQQQAQPRAQPIHQHQPEVRSVAPQRVEHVEKTPIVDKTNIAPPAHDAAPGVNKGVSSNAFASGSNMNAGNFITDRPTTRVHAPPGGRSQITFG
mmetsp:Transcript_9118/g.15117  ORF Transcript_9118/g.15117 Transcript_9118/m.15117 type:complete len:180 (+) Transcript_9118:85-624(+)